MSVLQQILKARREDVQAARRRVPLQDLQARIRDLPPPRGFAASLARPSPDVPIRLIAEFKRASPSGGLLREDADPAATARDYAHHGASALSVLTEPRFFQGSLEDLEAVRSAVGLPVLRKDFLVDPYQLHEARAAGADAVLLIVAGLQGRGHLQDLLGLAAELDLDALVEVHHWKELDQALLAGSRLIGINNRDLASLAIDLDTTFSLLKDIPPGCTVVSESGIRTRQDVLRLQDAGVDAILVGTVLMKAREPGAKVAELLGREDSGEAAPGR